MSDYFLKITEKINLSDYSTIYDYMGIVDLGDKFTIQLNSKSIENSDIIYSMLKDNNFNITSKGVHNDGKIYVTAIKNNNK